MNVFLLYVVQSALCLSLFYGLYLLLLRREAFFRFNRNVLLAVMVLSMTIPLIRVPVPEPALPIIQKFKDSKITFGEGFAVQKFQDSKIAFGEGFVVQKFRDSKIAFGEGFAVQQFQNSKIESFPNSPAPKIFESLNHGTAKPSTKLIFESLNP